MISSANLLSLFTLVTAGCCQASFFNREHNIGFEPEQTENLPIYLPDDVFYDPIWRTLLDLHPSISRIYEEKNTPSMTVPGHFSPDVDGNTEVQETKRASFWQPLGYMPASMRAHNNPSESAGSGNQDSGSNYFRYG